MLECIQPPACLDVDDSDRHSRLCFEHELMRCLAHLGRYMAAVPWVPSLLRATRRPSRVTPHCGRPGPHLLLRTAVQRHPVQSGKVLHHLTLFLRTLSTSAVPELALNSLFGPAALPSVPSTHCTMYKRGCLSIYRLGSSNDLILCTRRTFRNVVATLKH